VEASPRDETILAKIETADIERFMGRFSIGRDSNPMNPTGSLHFLRLKVPGGFLTTKQLRGVAELAEEYGRSRAEITNRQDIQLHWIDAADALEIFAKMDELGFTTDMCGQSFGGARYGDARNIVLCPVSGIEKDEILNGYPLMKELSNFLIGNPDFQDMPRKFKFSVSGCGSDCTRAETNDLSFVAVKMNGEVGYTTLLGGSMGSSLPGPRLAKRSGIFVKPEEAFDVAIATIEIHRDNSNREAKAKARFKWLLEEWGIKKFRNMLENKLGRPLESYDGPVFIEHEGHGRVQPQKQKGYYYMNLPLIGGALSSEQLFSLVDLADEYGSGELRLTCTQNLILPNIQEKELVLKRLDALGFFLQGSRLRWTSMGCASDFCGKTKSPHAKEVVMDIVEYLENNFTKEALEEAKLLLHASGCPNNCCANLIAEIGLRGRLLRDGEKLKQGYDIMLLEKSDQEQCFARVIEGSVPSEDVKYKLKSILSNYLKHRKPNEDFGQFCKRHTKEELRKYLEGNI
jgi:sulfite reductase beta subunit-like hemoprotein